ncbi:serine hydrolase [Sphingomonas parva]|uniref:Serine hydrolase n=1 Tax=Sphingomonas parva TaxID=2555898 RepID=A0A4Y8ZTK8_9SPHN|nr:serine hydrolase [Sphingomonas parva]TFI59350.1 serine hydrolase [Sphingomonas parva]
MRFRTLAAGVACTMLWPGLVAAAPGSAAAQAAPRSDDLKRGADALLQAIPANGPGAAAIVMRGGRIVYAAGRGLADLDTGRKVTADTVFSLGSITNQFTAAVVLQLVQEGRLSLDDPVSRFFPDYPQPTAAATVRQLLNHTSGIQDFSKIPGWLAANRTRPFTTAELLAVFRDRPAAAAPGEKWEYNNGGYVLLGAIVEKVTGKAWHEAVTERIASPLGLHTLAYGVTGEAGPAIARGYTEEHGRQQPVLPSHMSVPHAAGGLAASARDLAAWAQALHHGRIVGPGLYREMIRPARLRDGSEQPYGFGLRLRQLRGRPALVHGGAIAGFDTDSVYLPSEDLFVAVLANSDDPATDPSILTRRLAALALGEPFPTLVRADVPLTTIAPLFGTYEPRPGGADDGPPRRFFARDGRLFMARGEGEMEAFAAGDDRFFFGADELTWVRFVRKADGAHVVEVHRADLAAPDRAVRTGDAPAPFAIAPSALRSYAGTYATEGPVVTIAFENGQLTLQLPDGPTLPMRAVAEDAFMIDRARSRLVFHRQNGAIDRVTIQHGARVLNGRRVP